MVFKDSQAIIEEAPFSVDSHRLSCNSVSSSLKNIKKIKLKNINHQNYFFNRKSKSNDIGSPIFI